MFSGRVEARFKVPAGGAAVSASNGARPSATTVTVPAGNYYFEAAGGVNGLVSTLQSYLNDSVQGYPLSAAAMQAALGYGAWTSGAGWLLNEPSGNLAAAFGSPTLTATSLTYGTAGPRSGIDKAIGFDAGTDRADGGNVFNVAGTDDLTVALVAYIPAAPGSNQFLVSKQGASGAGWQIFLANNGELRFQGYDAATTLLFNCVVSVPTATWCAITATIDRSTGKARVGVRPLSGASSVSAEASVTATSMSNAVAFRLGDRSDNPGGAPIGTAVAALYVVAGASVATGLSANLSTALTNFANAVNAAWSVTLGSDGRVTIANSFWPASLAFTNTTLRTLLGFEYDFDYPQTAAQMAAALGYGTWSAGYLFNEDAGNASAAFGSPATLTNTAGTPTYGNQGPRGGGDKAIGLATNVVFSGADAFDADADLAFCAVMKLGPGDTAGDILGKGWNLGVPGVVEYILWRSAASTLTFSIRTAGGNSYQLNCAIPLNEWIAVMFALDRATGTARLGVHGLRTGTQTLSLNTSVSLSTVGQSSIFHVGNSTTVANADIDTQIAALYFAAGNGVAAGMPANLATALSNFATHMRSQTGTQHARGVWYPHCSINMEGDPRRAPLVSDLRQSMSPTGQVLGLVGNTYRRHRNVVWSHVPAAQVWGAEATYENGSWEEFFTETQLGLGSSWFAPSSPVQIYDHNNVQVGVDANVAGWYIVGVGSIEPRKSAGDWTGLWRIEIQQIVAVGT